MHTPCASAAAAGVARGLHRHCCRAAASCRHHHRGQLLLMRHHHHQQQHLWLTTTAAAAAARGASSWNAGSPVQRAADVPQPLCRRPAQHVAQLAALLQWRADVLQEIQHSIRDSFAATDGGPTAAELQREVTWVLDDAVAAWRELEAQQWLPCTWQQLQLEVASAQRRQQQVAAWQVQLRAPVANLQQLWSLRLKDRVPFQYLIHTTHWRDLVLSVGPGILVPRPETELMVDLAAAAIAATPTLSALPWADLGTGSGALAIGMARLLQQQQQQQNCAAVAAPAPSAQQPCVYAVDLSPTAAAYAAANASAHGVQDTVHVLQGSWFEPLQQAALHGKLGGVLSNPPYIPQAQLQEGLQAEVAQHEPLSALDGGLGAGMDSLRVICEQAVHMLAPGGFIVLETAGADQAPLVQQLLQTLRADGQPGGSESSLELAFVEARVHKDCYGVPRFVTASRASLA